MALIFLTIMHMVLRAPGSKLIEAFGARQHFRKNVKTILCLTQKVPLLECF